MPASPQRRARIALAACATLSIVALAGVWLAADRIAAWRTRAWLDGLAGARGSFETVDVDLLHLRYEVRGLRVEWPGGGGPDPVLRVDAARAALSPSALARGSVVLDGTLVRPELELVARGGGGTNAIAKPSPFSDDVARLPPFALRRLRVEGGELVLLRVDEGRAARLRLRGIEATLQNFATRSALAGSGPTRLELEATLERSGAVSAWVEGDPRSDGLSLVAEGVLDGLELREIASLVAVGNAVAPERGVFDLFVRFRADAGRVRGGVRSVVHGVELEDARSGIGAEVKERAADVAHDLMEDEGRTTDRLPIEGTIGSPAEAAVLVALTIFRNAFTEGLRAALSPLPSDDAPGSPSPEGEAHRAGADRPAGEAATGEDSVRH